MYETRGPLKRKRIPIHASTRRRWRAIASTRRSEEACKERSFFSIKQEAQERVSYLLVR